MTTAVIGGLSDLWAHSYVKWATGLGILFACPFWGLAMLHTALQASFGGN